MLLLTYTQPLLLTYPYNRINKKYKGNARTKARHALAEKHYQEDLEALKHWRDYEKLEKDRKEKEDKYYKSKEDIDEKSKKKIIIDIKKDTLYKLARYHYFIEFLVALVVGLIYIINFGFTITNLIIFIPFCTYIGITTLIFITNLIFSLRITTHIENLDLSKYVILRMGEPGTGKSSSGIYDAVEIAEKIWEEIEYKYWLIKNKINEIFSGTHLRHRVLGYDEYGKPIIQYYRVYTTDKDKILSTVEIVESSEYYSEHSEVIPCLWSDIPIFDKKGRSVSIFTADHFLQKEKLISFGIAFIDEISALLPTKLSTDKIEEVDLMFKFTRHYRDFRLILTEQDGSASLISARRVTAENRKMIKQTHILKPLILSLIFRISKAIVIKKEPTKNRVRYINQLNYYINSVGFRVYKYEDYGNLEVGNKGEISSRRKSFVAPPRLNCTYSSRTFKNLYKAKDMALNVTQFENEVLSKEELEMLFNKDIQKRAYKRIIK